jgi:taurine dioxygenase
VRVACHGERPRFDLAGQSQEEYLHEHYGLPRVNKDGARQSNYND